MSDIIPPVPPGTPIGSAVWADWYEKVRRVINGANEPVNLTSGVTGILPVANGGTGTNVPGISVTISTAKLTLAGTAGSMTFTNGILTAHTDAT